MTCEEARVFIGGDPEDASTELLAHVETCPACQTYRQQMLAINAKIRRALELDWQKVSAAARPGAPPQAATSNSTAPVTPDRATALGPAAADRRNPPASAPVDRPDAPTSATTDRREAPSPAAMDRREAPTPATTVRLEVPTSAATDRPDAPVPTAPERSNVTVLPRRAAPAAVPRQKRPRLVALAASIAAAMVAALTLWLSRPPPTLAAEIVKHVEGEPNSWYKTEPLQSVEINAVLRKSGVKLGPGMQSIVYASGCWFRGHFVPHFVVTTEDGPVTVMILLHEKVDSPQHFDEDGFAGLLVPASNGSVAVLSRTPMPLEKPASSVVKALQSTQ